MNMLLDTCALLALARGELPPGAATAVRTARVANVSVVSPWEVAIKAAAGKLHLKQPPIQWYLELVERYDLQELQLDAAVACAAAALPPIHRDPFDRVLVALAQTRTLTVVTSDQHIPQYAGVSTVW